MTTVLAVFSLSLLLCCVIAYILGLFWFGDVRNRRLPSFFLLGVEVFLWTLLNAVTMVIDPIYFPAVYTLRMVMVCIVPFGAVWFVLHFSRSKFGQSRAVRLLLTALPVADVIGVVTNPLHHLYFTDYAYPVPARGPLFWVHTGAGFLFIVLGIAVLLCYIVKTARSQPLVILTGFGMIFPYALNLLYSFRVLRFPHDATPIGFFLTFVLFVFVAYHTQLFNIKTALLSSAMDAVDDLIIIVNQNGFIINMNRHAPELLAGLAITMGRTPVSELYAHLDGIAAEQSPPDLLKTLGRNQYADGEMVIPLPGCAEKVKTYIFTRRDVFDGKNYSGYVISLSDVSRDRAMLREIHEQNEELLRLKTKAEAVSRAKGDFLANMSHEIRTPMNAIIGMTAIAKAADDPERIRYAIEKTEIASAHLLGVINDILDMSKIEANKMELSPAPFSFRGMLRKSTEMMNFRLAEKRQYFTMGTDPKIPPFLLGDEQRLTQVVTNLLSNAVKFTPERGEISLAAGLAREEGGLCFIEIKVADSGIGISEEQQARLFTPFVQAESSTTRNFGGTGLGLVISKSIVELMGGEIKMTSVLGRGSVFSCVIPMERAAELPEAGLPDEACAARRFEGRRILLAEDLEINREIVAALLEPAALEIDMAENGLLAVRKFEEAPERYDMIFMDIQMPEMDGYEATRKIRALTHIPKAASIPIVAMTANAFREDVERCLAAGMNGHVGKPLDFDEILRALRKFLR